MNKKTRKTFNWKSWFIVGLIGLLFLIGAGKAKGMFDFKSALSRILLNRIDTVIEKNLAESLEYLEQEDVEMGGLVEIFQKIFPEGLIIGTKEKGQSGVFQVFTDSDGNFYIGTSSDATFKIASDGEITLRDINLTTSTLNWSGDVAFGTEDLYVDVSAERVGIGTTTPSYQLEIFSKSNPAVVAITASSTDDAVIRINNGYQAQEWVIFMDNSDGDKLKIATSTDIDILTIDENGALTLTGALTQSGGVVSMATTTIVGPLVQGGDKTDIGWGNVTTTAAQICNSSILYWAASATTTVGLTGTGVIADCLPNIGDFWSVLFYNNSTTTASAAANLTASSTDAGAEDVILVGENTTDDAVPEGYWVRMIWTNFNGVTTTVELIKQGNAD